MPLYEKAVTPTSTDTLSNKTLTAPKFTDLGFIADANGNELIVMDTVASAVPYIRAANAAAGGVVGFEADGETNQHIQVIGKGNGLTKISVLRQDDTTGTYKHNSVILSGWGVLAIATGSRNFNETVTFGITFAQRPIVLSCNGGDALTASGTAYGTGANTISADWMSKCYQITTTTFVSAQVAPANVGANGYVWYQWIAIGELA